MISHQAKCAKWFAVRHQFTTSHAKEFRHDRKKLFLKAPENFVSKLISCCFNMFNCQSVNEPKTPPQAITLLSVALTRTRSTLYCCAEPCHEDCKWKVSVRACPISMVQSVYSYTGMMTVFMLVKQSCWANWSHPRHTLALWGEL